MVITKYVCDLCRAELDIRQEQCHLEYQLPRLSYTKYDEEDSLAPKRTNLCEDCAKRIKDLCVSIQEKSREGEDEG